MKISLLHKSYKDNKKESPLFVRVAVAKHRIFGYSLSFLREHNL